MVATHNLTPFLLLYLSIPQLQQRQAAIMSKLSPALKELINAPFARPGALPAPPGIKAFYQNLAKDAKARGVGVPAWLSMAVCDTHPFQTYKEGARN